MPRARATLLTRRAGGRARLPCAFRTQGVNRSDIELAVLFPLLRTERTHPGSSRPTAVVSIISRPAARGRPNKKDRCRHNEIERRTIRPAFSENIPIRDEQPQDIKLLHLH